MSFMSQEYEQLISKFYDLPSEEKKEEINKELKKMKEILKVVSSFSKDPSSNLLTEYNSTNNDTEDQNLTKIYHDIVLVEEALVFYLKDHGY